MFAYNHKDQVEKPNDVEAEHQTDDESYDFALLKSGNCAADPGRNGDYRKNNADNPGKSKVIAFSHNQKNLLIFID